jgi:hypothetical protein
MNTQSILNPDTIQIFKASIPRQITKAYAISCLKYVGIMVIIYFIVCAIARIKYTIENRKYYKNKDVHKDTIYTEINKDMRDFRKFISPILYIFITIVVAFTILIYSVENEVFTRDGFYEIQQELNVESEEFKNQIPDIQQFLVNQALYQCEFEKLGVYDSLSAGYKKIETEHGKYIYKEIAPKDKYLYSLDTNSIDTEQLQAAIEENAKAYIKNVMELRKFVELDKTNGKLIHNECKETPILEHCKDENKKPEEKQEVEKEKEQPNQEEIKENK